MKCPPSPAGEGRSFLDYRRQLTSGPHSASSSTPSSITPATMKLSWGFITSSLYCAASAAQQGNVYIYDPVPRTSPQAATTVDATTARLILAQRLGLSRFHTIEKTRSEESLKQINAFGGRHQKLFGGEDADRTQAHALVWIEGVEDVEGMHVASLQTCRS